MSTQPSTENRKQPPSVYTVMLLLSMIFLVIAVVAMWMELQRWAPDFWSTNTARPNAMVIQADNVRLVRIGQESSECRPDGVADCVSIV